MLTKCIIHIEKSFCVYPNLECMKPVINRTKKVCNEALQKSRIDCSY